MPANPSRSTRGGDVPGETATDVGLGLCLTPLQVAKASYQAHDVDLGSDADVTLAEIKQGYSSYGRRKVGQ